MVWRSGIFGPFRAQVKLGVLALLAVSSCAQIDWNAKQAYFFIFISFLLIRWWGGASHVTVSPGKLPLNHWKERKWPPPECEHHSPDYLNHFCLVPDTLAKRSSLGEGGAVQKATFKGQDLRQTQPLDSRDPTHESARSSALAGRASDIVLQQRNSWESRDQHKWPASDKTGAGSNKLYNQHIQRQIAAGTTICWGEQFF